MELSPPEIATAQCVGSIRSLGGDDADLRQKAAQRVEQLGALRHQKLAHFVVHQNSLIADRPYRHEPHRRSTDRFTNRRRVSRIVLLPANGRIQAVVATRSLSAGRRNRSSASAGVFQYTVFRG